MYKKCLQLYKKPNNTIKKSSKGTSLVVKGLRLRLLMQGVQAPELVREL